MAATPSLFDFGTAIGSLIVLVIPIIALIINIIFGTVAVSMAKKRNLRTVPAFFAGFFGSIVALFFIAMIPKNNGASWN